LLESFGITTCNKIYKCSQLVLKSFLENVLGKFSSLSSFKSITLEINKFKLTKNLVDQSIINILLKKFLIICHKYRIKL
jgi:hypothetical protein